MQLQTPYANSREACTKRATSHISTSSEKLLQQGAVTQTTS
jgi:hypothetical protein